MCPVCGEHLGYIAGFKGFGFRERRHTARMMTLYTGTIICLGSTGDTSITQRRQTPPALVAHAEQKIEDGLSFNGSWKLARAEGDWDAFLTEVGFGWAKRKFVAGLGYGVGALKEDIQQEMVGELVHMAVTTTSPMSTVENMYTINGEEQDGKTPENEIVMIIPYWEGDRLVVQTFDKQTRKKLATIERYRDGKGLRHRMTSGAVTVERFFERE